MKIIERKKLNKNNSSGIRGVHWRKKDKKWRAQIRINNKKVYLGDFKNKIDAAKAYNKAAFEYHLSEENNNYGN